MYSEWKAKLLSVLLFSIHCASYWSSARTKQVFRSVYISWMRNFEWHRIIYQPECDKEPFFETESWHSFNLFDRSNMADWQIYGPLASNDSSRFRLYGHHGSNVARQVAYLSVIHCILYESPKFLLVSSEFMWMSPNTADVSLMMPTHMSADDYQRPQREADGDCYLYVPVLHRVSNWFEWHMITASGCGQFWSAFY